MQKPKPLLLLVAGLLLCGSTAITEAQTSQPVHDGKTIPRVPAETIGLPPPRE